MLGNTYTITLERVDADLVKRVSRQVTLAVEELQWSVEPEVILQQIIMSMKSKVDLNFEKLKN